MKILTVNLLYFKSTKGTHVYHAKDQEPEAAVTSLYVKRGSLPDVPPQQIQIDLSFPE